MATRQEWDNSVQNHLIECNELDQQSPLTLTHADFNEISHGLDKWRTDREQERKRQQQRSSGGFELG